jgi:hypothetical protein
VADPLQLGFPELADFRREAEKQIVDLLFGRSPWPVTEQQKQLLQVLRSHCGRESAVPLADICARTKLGEREVKDLMRSLVVDFKLRIGAARSKPSGYYLVTTAEEAKDAAQVYESEIKELAKRVRVLRGPHFVCELLGQLRIQMDEEKAS